MELTSPVEMLLSTICAPVESSQRRGSVNVLVPEPSESAGFDKISSNVLEDAMKMASSSAVGSRRVMSMGIKGMRSLSSY